MLLAPAVPLLAALALAAGPPQPPLRIAMSGAFQPFSTTDATGALVGFDADIAREVAKRMGRTPALVQVDWAGIQAALQRGKVDVICGSMAITEERLQTMRFSLPYYVSGAQVFARSGIDDLSGRRVGVTEDSTYATYIAEHPAEFAGVEVLRFGSEATIVAALNTQKIDAFVSDRIVGGFYLSRAMDQQGAVAAQPNGPLLYQEACGIAVRLEDAELVRNINLALLAMVQDGTYAQIYSRWVGSPPDVATLLTSWGRFAGNLPGGVEDMQERAKAPSSAARIGHALPLLARGAWLTLLLSLLTAVLALITGTALGVLSVSRSVVVQRLATGYVWLVRGTPLLVQLFISYFAVATWVNAVAGTEVMGAPGAALLALVVNTTAYNAETVRGGILAVDPGQWEAAAALGMRRLMALRRIVLPQALRVALPSLGNNMVVLVKDTSLVGAITLVELTYAARNVVFQTGQPLLPFALAAVFYLAIISTLSLGLGAWERRLNRGGAVS